MNLQYFRLQSTHCEMRNYEGIIENLDYNLMMNLALGYVCVVYDYGSRGNGMEDEREGIPRAFWYVDTKSLINIVKHYLQFLTSHPSVKILNVLSNFFPHHFSNIYLSYFSSLLSFCR